MSKPIDSRRPTRTRLIALATSLSKARVAVVGDTVLDAFEFGEIARVSREAPVLILDHRRTDYVPGGAGNTATNLAALGVRTALIGRVGKDDEAAALRSILRKHGVSVSALLADPDYATPTKRRILAGSAHTRKQQIVRLDRGDRGVPLRAGLKRRLLAAARAARRRGDAVLLADYGYGAIDPTWPAALGRGTGAVTLDSRFALDRFAGIDAATPNLEELERAAGRRLGDDDEAAINAAGETLRRRIGCTALLATRGSRGMTLIERGQAPARIAVFGSDEVADVTGAGDTVIAVFTAARAAGGSWREAAELANVAGGLVVMKSGTATVTRQEVIAALLEMWSE
jgi:rfaE bifunctional protein kinase chain/domain